MINAIETEYAGHRFRSRLEARWAVFFDALRIRWQYEPEGYEFDGERYLPDFRLTENGMLVEVKGTDAALQRDLPRIKRFVESRKNTGLLILGEIPPVADDGLAIFPFFTRVNDEVEPHFAFPVKFGNGHRFAVSLSVLPQEDVAVGGVGLYGVKPAGEVEAAYAAARQARFEFGETPRR